MKRVILIGALILGAAVAAILVFAYFAGEQIIGPMLKCLGLEAVVLLLSPVVVVGIPLACKSAFMAVATGYVRLLLGKSYVEEKKAEKEKRKRKPAAPRFSIHLPTRPTRVARRKRAGLKNKRELDELLPPEPPKQND